MEPLPAEKLEELNKLMDAFYNQRDDSKLRSIFTIFDRNGNGQIEAIELQSVMSQVSGETVPENEIKEMIQEADINGNGVIELEEFVEIMKKHRDD